MESNGVDWTQLPHIVVVKIMSYLSDDERVSMAKVCTTWSPLIDSGCLWRIRRFVFGTYSEIGERKAIAFAAKHGRHLRDLEIKCRHPANSTKRFHKNISIFLSFLHGNAVLTDFDLSSLMLERYWRHEHTKELLFSTLSRFLKGQKRLIWFGMTSAQFSLLGGFKLLESLGIGSGLTLKFLNLEDFFHGGLRVFSLSRFVNLMDRFCKLRVVSLNYNCVSNDLIMKMAERFPRILKELNIKVNRFDPRLHRVDSFAWHILNNACPKLKVSMVYFNLYNCELRMRYHNLICGYININ